MDAMAERYPVADHDVIAYRLHNARGSCLAFHSKYDQKHRVYVEAALMLLRMHG